MKRKKVLLIEDTELDAKLLQRLFINFLPNIQLSLRNDVDTGANELISNEYDLLIFNLELQNKDGINLIDKIIPAHAPTVIILSNKPKYSVENNVKLKLLDVVAYIVKPLDERNIIPLVSSALINY